MAKRTGKTPVAGPPDHNPPSKREILKARKARKKTKESHAKRLQARQNALDKTAPHRAGKKRRGAGSPEQGG